MTFARALEACGFDVSWVAFQRSVARKLTAVHGHPLGSVLDITEGFASERIDPETARAALAALEPPEGPRINDIILMDRLLRTQPYDVAVAFLYHVQLRLAEFLRERRVELVTSGRDTAPQIVAMLLCRQLGIPFVIPTRLRIPREYSGYSRNQAFGGLIQLRPVTDADRQMAADLIDRFDTAARPAVKIAARSFTDVLALLPVHVRRFSEALAVLPDDAGNAFTRYTVPQLMRMYVRRRYRMALYKMFAPVQEPRERPFCIYALHTQPESSIDVAGSYFSDQTSLVTFIARAMPASHDLCVKVHPTDMDGQPLAFYQRLAAIPGVRLIDYSQDSRALLRRAGRTC